MTVASTRRRRSLTQPDRAETFCLKLCLPLLFLLLGLVFATWASRIPAVRDALHLSAAQLGVALLCAGIGGLASFPVAARMVPRYGQAKAALGSGLGLLVALLCIAFSDRLGLLMAALGLLGGAASCFDVAINAIGALAEKKAGRSIMSMLHAWFCVGTVTGALGGGIAASLGFSAHVHFCLVATVMLTPLWWSCRMLDATRNDPVAATTQHCGAPPEDIPAIRELAPSSAPMRCEEALSWPSRLSRLEDTQAAMPNALPGTVGPLRRPLLVLGLIGFCGAIAEGGIADWSGVFMRDHVGASAGVAPLGYAGFSGAMLLARLFADRAKDRFGARGVVVAGALLAMVGIAIAVAGAASALGAILPVAGFAFAGAGLAGVFPFVFSAAGKEGAQALAGVATVSYCGSLVGPPVIGFIAQSAGLPAALACLGGLCVALASVASRAHALS